MTKREIELWLDYEYPTTIISDRYNGTYSKGGWLAFPLEYYNIPAEVDGDDVECAYFWKHYDGLVGRGFFPEAAHEDLINQMKQLINKQ